jgi:hypothetical protein
MPLAVRPLLVMLFWSCRYSCETAPLVYQRELKPRTSEMERTSPATNISAKPTSSLTNEEIIRLAKQSKIGNKFSLLWAGDITGYASPSDADLALGGHLAFWAGRNPDRIDQLFRKSGLMRDKWNRYGRATIDKALNGRTEFFCPSPVFNAIRPRKILTVTTKVRIKQ